MKKVFVFGLLFASVVPGQPLELVSVKKIWQGAKHSAFGDPIRFHDRWVAVFREGGGHVPANHAGDGENWKSQALIAEDGVDLRDPHVSFRARGQLMIVAGGSVYEKKVYMGRQPRVTFSSDGVKWSAPIRCWSRGTGCGA